MQTGSSIHTYDNELYRYKLFVLAVNIILDDMALDVLLNMLYEGIYRH